MKRRFRLLAALCAAAISTSTATADEATAGRDATARRDAIIVRALERMPGYDYSDNERVQAAVKRHLGRLEATPEFLPLIKRFRPQGADAMLERLVLGEGSDSDAVEATGLLIATPEGRRRVSRLLRGDDPRAASRVATLLGLLGNGRSVSMLARVASEADRPFELRAAAARGLARSNLGVDRLLEMASEETLPGDLRLLAGGLLATAAKGEARQRAAELLPLPQQADQKPLPPLGELAQLRGDVDRGREMFRTKGTCSNCHQVDGFGKNVGPDLSEIGSKLSREAMLTAILDPSAGISHNYENYVAVLGTGQIITGLKMSETADTITIRTAEAIDRVLNVDEIDVLKKSEQSIMPENLHHATGQQGLIDIVEYLMTLKKKS